MRLMALIALSNMSSSSCHSESSWQTIPYHIVTSLADYTPSPEVKLPSWQSARTTNEKSLWEVAFLRRFMRLRVAITETAAAVTTAAQLFWMNAMTAWRSSLRGESDIVDAIYLRPAIKLLGIFEGSTLGPPWVLQPFPQSLQRELSQKVGGGAAQQRGHTSVSKSVFSHFFWPSHWQ
jgi:hypothetical protein